MLESDHSSQHELSPELSPLPDKVISLNTQMEKPAKFKSTSMSIPKLDLSKAKKI